MHERFIKYTNITHQISQLHNLYNYLISLTNTNFDVISSLTCIYLFCYHTRSERQSRLFYGMCTPLAATFERRWTETTKKLPVCRGLHDTELSIV